MESTYNLLSQKEPTEKQLHDLMSNVVIEVKKRAKTASQKLQKLQGLQIEEAFKKYNESKNRNE
ncbi:hypothetical protein [Flavobacterium sp.]|uniref:hypothetical protein n=1 Tax=Flavobacterium sp. TaxID=239 RepID=UPI00286CE92A|nr:hypothetical protein [Flavobacterium sp.]